MIWWYLLNERYFMGLRVCVFVFYFFEKFVFVLEYCFVFLIFVLVKKILIFVCEVCKCVDGFCLYGDVRLVYIDIFFFYNF